MNIRPATTAASHVETCYRITPGNSVIAHVGPDGTRSLHEMPSAAANAIAIADPARTLIVATWPGGAK